MKKLYYESPTVEVVDVRVEAGFAPSDLATNDSTGGEYGTLGEGDASEVDSY